MEGEARLPLPWGIADKAPSGLRDWLQGSGAAQVSGVLCWGSMSAQALGSHRASGPPTYPIQGSCRELSAPWPPPRGRGEGAPGSTSTLV